MKSKVIFTILLMPMFALAKWNFVPNQVHNYWQENGCYAYEVSTSKVPTEIASLEVYGSLDAPFSRPLVQVLTQGMPDFFEGKIYFDEDPTDVSFTLVKMKKTGDTLFQSLTLKPENKSKLADLLTELIQRDTVHVSLRSKKGEVKKLNFSLSKSSDNIRKALNQCFTKLSADVAGV